LATTITAVRTAVARHAVGEKVIAPEGQADFLRGRSEANAGE